MRMDTVTSPRSAFTLVEILIVIAIIALLAALLFPAFSRARESGRQTTCVTNLHQISIAVQQYFQDERRYPDSLVDLLPEGSKFNDTPLTVNGVIAQNTSGYLKNGSDGLLCPDDDLDNTTPRSSYGSLSKIVPTFPATPTAPATDIPPLTGTGATPDADVGRYAYNYWGYNVDGLAYPDSTTAANTPDGSPLLRTPTHAPTAPATMPVNNRYDARKNPIRYSLSNRFAPGSTIITHCMFHRVQTADDLTAAGLMSYGGKSVNARDIVLRLDGTAKAVLVPEWKSDPTGNKWQNQTP